MWITIFRGKKIIFRKFFLKIRLKKFCELVVVSYEL
jgi:hypothetical protein